jgi:5-oxopent-3-ene-1,2,5-tricarboxylate decarboxylase/2-hydroxyhepta-2,4-diene-1,7-dioate isomerase
MKLLRFHHLKNEQISSPRTGLLFGGDTIADLRVGYAKYLIEKAKDPQGREIAALRIASSIVNMIAIGKPALEAMESSAAFLAELLKSNPTAKGPAGEPLFMPLAECKVHAPIRPTKIVVLEERSDNEEPAISIKPNNTIHSPFRDILIPDHVTQLECETKLAVIIGKTSKDIAEEQVDARIFGYMVANDVALEHGKTRNNMFDTFLPAGPWVVTADEIRDPMNLMIRAWVNDKAERNSSTKDMPLSLAQLISYVSRKMKLEVGDMVLTGAPRAGSVVLSLRLGDTLDSEIEGIGRMRNKVGTDPSK